MLGSDEKPLSTLPTYIRVYSTSSAHFPGELDTFPSGAFFKNFFPDVLVLHVRFALSLARYLTQIIKIYTLARIIKKINKSKIEEGEVAFYCWTSFTRKLLR